MNNTIDSQVLVAFIAALGGIITTWLTVKYKHLVVKRQKPAPSKDRMQTIFDGYEKLIVQQQSEIDRKSSIVKSLQEIVHKLEEELQQTKVLLFEAQDELRQSRTHNNELKDQLDAMWKQYKQDSDK